MQADRFTIKSQEAVAAAQRLAAQRRNPEVLCEHLLVALLEQEDGFAPAALRKLSADVAAITSRANARPSTRCRPSRSRRQRRGPGGRAAADRRDLSAPNRRWRRFGDEYISVGHLLLALADDAASTPTCSPTATRWPRP